MIQKFEFIETAIAGLFEVQPFFADDLRGYFLKDYSKEIPACSGVCTHFMFMAFTT